MKLHIIFSLFAYINARIINKSVYHKKEIVKKDINYPFQFAIDYATNTLYFSYTNFHKTLLFQSAYINLNTNEFHDIEGIKAGFANAVDSQTHTVYLGGLDGLYTFDFNSKTAKHINGTFHNIWQIFYKKDIYYSTFPEQQVYVFKNGETKRLPELENTRARLIALDNNDNIYFGNSSGLYFYKKPEKYVTFLGNFSLTGITSDKYGNLFFSTAYDLYSIDENSKKIDKIAPIDELNGLAIEEDGNILYATIYDINRLCIVDESRCDSNVKYDINVL